MKAEILASIMTAELEWYLKSQKASALGPDKMPVHLLTAIPSGVLALLHFGCTMTTLQLSSSDDTQC